MNTIDGPTKLVRQDAILGGLSIGQLSNKSLYHIRIIKKVILSGWKFKHEFCFLNYSNSVSSAKFSYARNQTLGWKQIILVLLKQFYMPVAKMIQETVPGILLSRFLWLIWYFYINLTQTSQNVYMFWLIKLRYSDYFNDQKIHGSPDNV